MFAKTSIDRFEAVVRKTMASQMVRVPGIIYSLVKVIGERMGRPILNHCMSILYMKLNTLYSTKIVSKYLLTL